MAAEMRVRGASADCRAACCTQSLEDVLAAHGLSDAPLGPRQAALTAALLLREGQVVAYRAVLSLAWRGVTMGQPRHAVNLSALRARPMLRAQGWCLDVIKNRGLRLHRRSLACHPLSTRAGSETWPRVLASRAWALRAEGKTPPQIAADLGCSLTTVYAALREAQAKGGA